MYLLSTKALVAAAFAFGSSLFSYDAPAQTAFGMAKGGEVAVYSIAGLEITRFYPEGEKYKGGVRVAAGRLDGNTLVVTGASTGGFIRAFSAPREPVEHPEELFGFQVEEGFQGAAIVALYDLNNDDKSELIAASGDKGSGMVRIYDVFTTGVEEISELAFQPFDVVADGNVSITVGDAASSDEVPEIIVGSGRGNQVVVHSLISGNNFMFLQPFPDGYDGGVNVGFELAGGINPIVVCGSGAGDPNLVTLINTETSGRFSYSPFGPKYKNGVTTAGGDPLFLLGAYFRGASGFVVAPAGKGLFPIKPYLIDEEPISYLFNGIAPFGLKYQKGIHIAVSQRFPEEA